MWNRIVTGLLIVAIATVCHGACDEPCRPPPKHYTELGCKPVLEEGQCCPKRYECPELTDRDGNKCYLNGNIYEAGARLSKVDQEQNSCSPACFCSNNTQPASFVCASIDCGEFFSHKPDCVHQYEVHSCCAARTVCGAERDKLAQCYLDGEQYYEGQRMYPRNDSCTSCLCKPGFDNSTIAGNPHCQESHCGIELHGGERLARGCIPIYYGDDRCCPISWKCPSDGDTVLADGRSDVNEANANPKMQCKFGKLTLNKDDGLSSDDQCVECKCTIPPLAHCIQRENC